MKLGVGKIEITPPLGIPTGGGGPDGYEVAQYVLDPLFLRAMYFENALSEKLLLIQADLLGLSREKTGKIAKQLSAVFDIREDKILVVCPQSHNSGTTFNTDFPDDKTTEFKNDDHRNWFLSLDKYAIQAVKIAIAAKTEVQTYFARGFCSGVCSGRRAILKNGDLAMAWNDPPENEIVQWNKYEPEVVIVRFDDKSTGKPIGGLWHFSGHPNSLWMLQCFSRDYPGIVEDMFTELYGKNFVFSFLNGFCGDVDTYRNMNVTKEFYTYPFYKKHSEDKLAVNISEMKRLGTKLGNYLLKLNREIISNPMFSEELNIVRKDIACEIRKSDKLDFTSHFNPNVEVVVAQIQDIVLACAPFEPVWAISKRIKEKSSHPLTFAVGHTPYYAGYLLDKLSFDQGGFETHNAWRGYDAGTDELVVRNILSMIKKREI